MIKPTIIKAQISYDDARDKYRNLRLLVLRQLNIQMKQHLPDMADELRFSEIDNSALEAQMSWPKSEKESQLIGWNWTVARDRYRANYVKRLELAIWYRGQLCGLMLGKASEGSLVVKLNFIQGLPKENPLTGMVVPIADLCADLYATALDCQWVGIQEPMDDPKLIDYYRSLGFTEKDPFDPRNNAMFRRVDGLD